MQLKNIKIILSIAVIVLMGWVAINLGFFKPELTPLSASIAVSRTPLSAPFYIADQLGFFKENGLEIKIIDVIGGKNSFKMIMSGQADYGTSSESVLMFESIKKPEFVNLASFVESDNDIKLLILASSTGADLTGKKIGIIKGTASEYFLSLYLGLNNLKLTDVELINLSPSMMTEALVSHKVDAVSVWEPYAFEIKQALRKDIELAKAKNIYSLTFNLLKFRGSKLTNKSEYLIILGLLGVM